MNAVEHFKQLMCACNLASNNWTQEAENQMRVRAGWTQLVKGMFVFSLYVGKQVIFRTYPIPTLIALHDKEFSKLEHQVNAYRIDEKARKLLNRLFLRSCKIFKAHNTMEKLVELSMRESDAASTLMQMSRS